MVNLKIIIVIVVIILILIMVIVINKFEKQIFSLLKKNHKFNLKGKIKNYY